MNSSPANQTLFRLTGGALIASAVISIAGGVLHPIVDGNSHSVESITAPLSPYAQYLIYLGSLFLIFGLPGMFVWLKDRIGKVGLVGIALYMLGNALSAQSHLVVEAFVAPAIANDPAARHLVPADGSIVDFGPFLALQAGGGLLFVLSLILIGIGLWRNRIVPRWISGLLVVGAVAVMMPFPEVPGLTGLLVEVPRGVAVAAVGLQMMRTMRVGNLRDAASQRALVEA